MIDWNDILDIKINAKNEKDLETQLCVILNKNGWHIERQVSSNEKNRTTHRPLFRADLIIYHEKYKELGLIGIELKYLRQVRCGGKFGQHLHQILKYRDCHFKGRQIDTWVLGAYFQQRKHETITDDEAKQMIATTQVYTSQLINQFGIGWLNLHDRRLKLDFMSNDCELKISLEKPEKEWDYEYKPHITKIKNLINEKRIVKVIKYE